MERKLKGFEAGKLVRQMFVGVRESRAEMTEDHLSPCGAARFCKSSIFSCRLYGMRNACAVIFMSGTITRGCSDEILVV